MASAHGDGAFTARPFPLLLEHETSPTVSVNLRELFAHHVIFVGGKGGVGKTTVAAALGVEAAARGHTCLVVSTDPAHSLGDIFDTPIGEEETSLAERLTGLEIDPDRHAERHIETIKAQMKALVHPRLYDEIDRQLNLAKHAPGATEAALLERVAELMGDSGSRFDLVVFDTAPSGHTVRMLSLPEVMGAWTDGLLRHRQRSSRLSAALRHLGGGAVKGDDLSMIDQSEDYHDDELTGRLNDTLQTRRRKFLVARDRLLDPTTTAFLLVVNPDKLSILESRRVVELLLRLHIDVTSIVVNRVLPSDLDEGRDQPVPSCSSSAGTDTQTRDRQSICGLSEGRGSAAETGCSGHGVDSRDRERARRELGQLVTVSPAVVALGALLTYAIAYRYYARHLAARLFELDGSRRTPAHVLRDDVDYVPTHRLLVFGHHYASITGLSPMLGPAVAVIWGWLPATLWVVFGAVLVGAVHDFGALVVSLRARGASIGKVTESLVGRRGKTLFHLVIFFLIALAMGVFVHIIATLFSPDFYPESVLPSGVLIAIALGAGLTARRRAWEPGRLAGLAARGESRSYEGSTQSIRRTTLTRMAMGTRETDQPPLWIATSDLPTSPGHPFYARLTTLLDGHHFDRFVEGLCDRFYAPVMGRPSLAPGRYFRLLLVGYFEGIDSERGIAWRATDSLAVRSFLRLAVDEAPPDHSTIARTRRLIDLETHRTVFTWVQQRLVEAGRLTGKTIAVDATTLEANAAMRSIVRRDTGESYQAFLAGLATASGVETPTREGLARLDRKRKKKTSNTDWTHPHDPDAKVTKMKDGRTHLAHKAEHAVDMETGAIVAVTLQGADVGDTTTIIETAIAATEQVEDAQANVDDRQSLEEIVGDKGYHSNQTLIDLDAVGIRSYVSEPDRGRRDWSKDPEARAPVYSNRRRMRGRRGRRLMRQRGERIERSFAHLYDTGGMRRTHLRGHTNILKRLLIHAGGFNLGLVMRHLIGIGTPRGLQGRVAAVLATLGVLMGVVRRRLTTISSSHRLIPAVRGRLASLATFAVNSSAAITCTTGC